MNVVALKQQSSLTDLDWRVVGIARADGPRSINPEGRFTRFLREFVGVPIARSLANPKLEALRATCTCLRKAGYSSIAMLQILAHVAGLRGFTPSLQEELV